MSKLFRAVVALALVAGLSATGVGRRPDSGGVAVSVRRRRGRRGHATRRCGHRRPHPGGHGSGSRTHHVDLDTTGDTPPDIVTEVGTVTRVLFVDA